MPQGSTQSQYQAYRSGRIHLPIEAFRGLHPPQYTQSAGRRPAAKLKLYREQHRFPQISLELKEYERVVARAVAVRGNVGGTWAELVLFRLSNRQCYRGLNAKK